MFAIRTPAAIRDTNEGPNVIMYLWTAPGSGAAGFRRATGVSDDQDRAREAAEVLLRSGQASTAYIERVHAATCAPTLSFCYLRTGTGWRARVRRRTGRVIWTPFPAAGGHHRGNAADGECGPPEEADDADALRYPQTDAQAGLRPRRGPAWAPSLPRGRGQAITGASTPAR